MSTLGWIGFYSAAAAFGYFYFFSASDKAVAVQSPPERVWDVRSTVAEANSFSITRSLRGAVAARRERVLSFKQAGCIAEYDRNIQVGDEIAAGKRLATLDDKRAILELERVKSRKAIFLLEATEASKGLELRLRARARAEKAYERNLKRYTRQQALFERKILSNDAMDIAELSLQEAEENFETAEDNVLRAQMAEDQVKGEEVRLDAELALARLAVEEHRLIAPTDAIVLETELGLGSCFETSDPVLRYYEKGGLEIHATISRVLFERLKRTGPISGRNVQIAPANSGCESEIVSSESSISDPNSVTLRIRLPDMCGRTFGIYDQVLVDVVAQRLDDVVRLPVNAEQGDRIVYTIEDERLRPNTVVIADRDDSWIYISSGISSGDTVLTSKPLVLLPDQKVRIIGQ